MKHIRAVVTATTTRPKRRPIVGLENGRCDVSDARAGPPSALLCLIWWYFSRTSHFFVPGSRLTHSYTRTYLSLPIAKHFMRSKSRVRHILDTGSTGLLLAELVNIHPGVCRNPPTRVQRNSSRLLGQLIRLRR